MDRQYENLLLPPIVKQRLLSHSHDVLMLVVDKSSLSIRPKENQFIAVLESNAIIVEYSELRPCLNLTTSNLVCLVHE